MNNNNISPNNENYNNNKKKYKKIFIATNRHRKQGHLAENLNIYSLLLHMGET